MDALVLLNFLLKVRPLWNTKFFHRVANNRRKFNTIHSICVDGASFDENSSVKEAVVNFYKKLYEEDYPSRPFLEGLVYDSISENDACDLLREFSKEEVWKAINDLSKEKAPGPDGFNIAFFQSCWSIVKKDVRGLFSEFHSKGVFEKSLNATFICLIQESLREDA